MKNSFTMAMMVALVCSSYALAQKQPMVTTVRDRDGQYLLNWPLSPDEPLLLRLSYTLNVRKARIGDPVTAEILRSLEENNHSGSLKNSILTGHVTQVARFSKAKHRSILGIEFDQIQLPDGSTRAFRGMIQALGTYPEGIPRTTCFFIDSTSAKRKCVDVYDTVDLTGYAVGIFNLDSSLDPRELLAAQLVVSNRHNVKLPAGTRMVVRGKIATDASAKHP